MTSRSCCSKDKLGNDGAQNFRSIVIRILRLIDYSALCDLLRSLTVDVNAS